MLELLLMVSALMGATDDVTLVGYEGTRAEMTAEGYPGPHDGRFNGWADCTSSGCEIMMTAGWLESIARIRAGDTAGIGNPETRIETLVHEYLHVLDYQDDGIYNGSPWGGSGGHDADFAHELIEQAIEDRCITADLCIDTLGTAASYSPTEGYREE